jgi:hypothetical protein
MARDDYTDYGNRGRQRGPDTFNDREWQQGAQWQHPQGFQGYQGGYGQSAYGGYDPQSFEGGYGQGWSARGGFGQGGYGQGSQGGYGQQWGGGQSAWQGREGQRMYGQGMYGPGMYGPGMYGPGMYGQGMYGQSGYGQPWSGQGQGGFGEGRESWPGQSQEQGRDYPRRDYGMEPMRGGEPWGGGYGSAFAGQPGYWRQGYAGQGYGQQAVGEGYGQQRMPRGQYVGRGPKGYQRSDERIREDINEELTRHPEIDASEIEVTVDGAEVTLVGVVEDRRAKRLAEDIVERTSGVNDVNNQLRVRHGLGEKASSMHPGGRADQQTGGDRESSVTRSRAGRSTSSSRS